MTYDGQTRIAIFVPSMGGGGVERVMADLANRFVTRGLEVDLVLAEATGPYIAMIAPEVRLVDLGAKRVIASLPALMRYLRKEKPCAMLSAMDHVNVVAILARLLTQVNMRLVVSVRNTISISFSQAASRRVRLLPILMRLFYPLADSLVAISRGVADDLSHTIGLHRERIEVIYNPVDIHNLNEKAEAEINHGLINTAGPPFLLGAGRLSPQKDFATLIQAFAVLRRKRPVRLMILGEGDLREELEVLVRKLDIEDAVELPGFVDNPFVYMKHAAVFILSSRWEGFGNVLIEAMACGTPVISADCPSGPAEILENGKWGRLVPVGDVEALARAMELTLDDLNPPDVCMRAHDFKSEKAAGRYLRLLMPDR